MSSVMLWSPSGFPFGVRRGMIGCGTMPLDTFTYYLLKVGFIPPLRAHLFFGRKVFGNCHIDGIRCYADFSRCYLPKGLYFSCLHDIAVCISWFFYYINQYVSASCIQYFRYYCKRWKYSGAYFCTEYPCSFGFILHLYLDCTVYVTCYFFASQKEMRWFDVKNALGGVEKTSPF